MSDPDETADVEHQAPPTLLRSSYDPAERRQRDQAHEMDSDEEEIPKEVELLSRLTLGDNNITQAVLGYLW